MCEFILKFVFIANGSGIPQKWIFLKASVYSKFNILSSSYRKRMIMSYRLPEKILSLSADPTHAFMR